MTNQNTVTTTQIRKICENPTFQRYLQFISGNDQNSANRVYEPTKAKAKGLCFVSDLISLKAAVQDQISILIILEKLWNESKSEIQKTSPDISIFTCPNVSAAMALVLPLFDTKRDRFFNGTHPSAVVHHSAVIGKNCRIDANVTIGPNAIIGDNCCIGAATVVESHAKVGSNTILHPQVFIGASCLIGNHCEIHPHTTIGSDGFGYVQGHDQKRHKIPQLGIVVVEDFVEFGGNCCIDRATLGETRIGEGTKFDNLCHVAHNCKIGKNNVFAGGFFVAGSSEIGDNCMTGGNVAVADHVKIGNDVALGGRSAVTKDVLQPGAYSGYPLEPMRDAMKTIANLAHLTTIRKQLNQIRKHLGLKDE